MLDGLSRQIFRRPLVKTSLMPIDRRAFLLRSPGRADAEEPAKTPQTLDLHVHLFGVGDNGSGCRMSPKITDGLQFQGLVFALGLRRKGKSLDEAYERVLADDVKASTLSKAAILGQDAVYDRHGKPDWERTSFFVPNDHVFDVVARHSETMIACPSINPARGDALDELERIHEKGARLFKIHPPTQGVDLSDARHKPFFRRCAELRIVVMVHTGHEHSAPVIDKHFASPEKLETALDLGCDVVACHSGSGWAVDEPDQLPQFVALLDRYPKQLWGDTAVLGTAGRVRDFQRLLKLERVRDRLLHGSDFPFPVAPGAFASQIGNDAVRRVAAETGWIQRDLALKSALGIGEASATRAWRLVLGTRA